MKELKAAHRQQLEVIEARVQGVLKKKDATIASLREEVAVLTKRMSDLGSLDLLMTPGK